MKINTPIKNKKTAKIIAIVGPNASGKSELAVKVAKCFNGEIISADSRQVYKGLDIGTGKVPKDKILNFQFPISKQIPNSKFQIRKQYYYKKIKHHCIDVVSPKKIFTVADFKKCAEAAIKDITSRGKVPILCGGTGFYIDSVLYDLPIPNVPPNQQLRVKLSKKSAAELFRMLKKLDPRRAKIIDRYNPQRLIRAIEIVKGAKKPVPPLTNPGPVNKTGACYSALILGIKIPKEKLYKRIDKRLKQQIKQGMIQEVKNLLKKGVSHKRLQSLGLEYRFISLYLQKKLTHSTGSGQAHKEMEEKLKNAIHQYAKRQMTWFKRNKDIYWINADQKTKKRAVRLSQEFLKNA